MAVIPQIIERAKTFGDNTFFASWIGLAKGDTGQPFENTGWADRTIQITGTFDSAVCTWEGSNDGVTYLTLTDAAGAPISRTADAIVLVMEGTRYMRPAVAGSGGTTALNVYLCARRNG